MGLLLFVYLCVCILLCDSICILCNRNEVKNRPSVLSFHWKLLIFSFFLAHRKKKLNYDAWSVRNFILLSIRNASFYLCICYSVVVVFSANPTQISNNILLVTRIPFLWCCPCTWQGKKTGAYVYDSKALNNLNLCLYVTGHVCTYGNVCFSLPGM